MKTPELTIYRCNLPHWRMEGSVYFVTWRLKGTQLPLSAEERSSVELSLKYFDGLRYELLAYVVMDDHVHALIQPAAEFSVESLVHSWKSYTAKQLTTRWGRASPVWQPEYFDRIIRDETELMKKMKCILENAGQRWPEFVDNRYPWMGIK